MTVEADLQRQAEKLADTFERAIRHEVAVLIEGWPGEISDRTGLAARVRVMSDSSPRPITAGRDDRCIRGRRWREHRNEFECSAVEHNESQ